MRQYKLIGMLILVLAVVIAGASLAQAAAASTTAAAGPLTLEYKFTPGQALTYMILLQANSTTTMQPATTAPQAMKLQGNMQVVERTREVAPDGASVLVELSCPRISMDATMAGQMANMLWQNGQLTLTVNGQKQPAAGMDFSRIPFLGVPLRVRMDKHGKVLELPDLSALKNLLGNMDLTSLIKTSQSELPDHPIQVGESWTTDATVPFPGSDQTITARTTYTLVGYETVGGRRAARLAMKTNTHVKGLKMNLPGTAPQGAAQSATIDDMVQNLTGNVWFSPELGQVVKSDAVMDMIETVSTAGPAGPQRTTISMNMKMTMLLQ